MTLTIKDSPAVAQAWLVGVNPELGDRVPIRLLKESNLDQVAGTIVVAARAFAAGGGVRLASPSCASAGVLQGPPICAFSFSISPARCAAYNSSRS
jgi:hypothetical protein